MATNKVQNGEVITLEKADVSAGDIVVEGFLKGVALIDTDDDGYTEIATGGVWDLDVTGNDGSEDAAVSIGDKVYTDGSDLSNADSGTFFGIALEPVVAGATTEIQVLIVQG